MASEFEVLAGVVSMLGAAPAHEVWAGDDAAVLGDIVVTVDPLVDGVHLDRSLMSLADGGWKLAARNVSDVVAMGARPWRAVVSVVGAAAGEVAALYDGITGAAAHWGFAVVGGDLAGGATLVATMTLLGRLDGHEPLLRSGAEPDDDVWLWVPGDTGLGRGAAGLRLLRAGEADGPAQRWTARPEPVVAAGAAARDGGATAAIDISDGLAADLGHLADASGVGFELGDIPVDAAATPAEAVAGGDEYALVFTAPAGAASGRAFADAGLTPPVRIGRCVADPAVRALDGGPLPGSSGWVHEL